MPNVAIIPARGGSSRIPHKNRKLFHGKPIIAYSIMAAFDSGLFEEVIVSTDCEHIAFIAEAYGAKVQMRDEAHSKDEVGTQEVARYVLDQHEKKYELACVIYPTAPMLTAQDLILAMTAMSKARNFVMSVSSAPLSDAGQFYLGRSEAFGTSVLIHPNTAMYPIPANRVKDINTPEDWAQAEDMYAALVRNGTFG